MSRVMRKPVFCKKPKDRFLMTWLKLYIPCKHQFYYYKSLFFGWFEALRPSQQSFSHVGTFSWVAPVLSNEDKASCSRTQHLAPGGIQTRDLAIKESGTLPTEPTVLPIIKVEYYELHRCVSMMRMDEDI